MLILGQLIFHGGNAQGPNEPYYSGVEYQMSTEKPLPCSSNYDSCISGVGVQARGTADAMADTGAPGDT